MAKECFCGCGREVPFGRRRAANLVGHNYAETIAALEGALASGAAPEQETRVRALVTEGSSYRDAVREVVHGMLDRKQLDKPAMKDWWDRATDARKQLEREAEAPEPGQTGREPAADPLDRLAKLGRLRDDGIITAEEFEAKKRELLDEA